MKKLARELSSIYKGRKALFVVPGYDRSFLEYLTEEIDSSEIFTNQSIVENKVYISTYPPKSPLLKARNVIIVSNFNTRSLTRVMDQVIVKKSEDLMREAYLRPFRYRRFLSLPDHKVSQLRIDFILSLRDPSVLPANVKEMEILSSKGVKIIQNVEEVHASRVTVICRKLNQLPYLQLRSTVLHGGELIDMANNLENWHVVTLGELGYFNFNHSKPLEGIVAEDRPVVLIEERTVEPRSSKFKVEMERGRIKVNGSTIAEYKVRGQRMHMRVDCGRNEEISFEYPSLQTFLSPMTTGRCTLLFSCVKRLKNLEACKEISLEAYLMTKNYVLSVGRTNFEAVILSSLNGVTMRDLNVGRNLRLKVMDEILDVYIKLEENYFIIKCKSCEKFKETRVRVRRVEDNYNKLINTLKDMLLKEMITLKDKG